ncbi:MAG: HEAT repeat domain-containing protein [Candidatus Zipacnadales bacterium]
MRAICTKALCLLMFSITTAMAQTNDALFQQLRDNNPDQRLAAAQELGRRGPEVLSPLFEMLGGEDRRLDLCARLAIQWVVQHAASPEGVEQRQAVAKAMADLALSNKPLQTRIFAVQQLGFCGGDEVLPAMWELLMFQPPLHEITRWALLRMPGQEPINLLKRAASEVGSPEQLVGILNALATRASLDMLPLAMQALSNDAEAVRMAALNLLAHLPDLAAADLIATRLHRGTAREQDAAARAYITAAYTLLNSGKPAAAHIIFEKCADWEDKNLRAAGIAGLGATGDRAALPRLISALFDESPVVCGAAVQALVKLPGEDVTETIAKAVTSSLSGTPRPTEVVLLLRILGERGDMKARPTLLQSLKHEDEAVRVEAMRSLSKLGDTNPSTVGEIVSAMVGGSDTLLEAAESTLSRMPGDPVTDTIAQACDNDDARVRRVLIRALGNRGVSQRLPVDTLLSALEDEDEGVRLAAISSLERLRDPSSVVALVTMLSKQGPEATAAEKALSRFTSPEATETLKAAFVAPDATPTTKAGLLRALAVREDAALFEFFMEAAKAQDTQIMVAALDALSRLHDVRAVSVFREFATSGTPDIRRAAMRGYLALAEAGEKDDPSGALGIYKETLAAEVGEEEKRQALRGIGRLADVSALDLVEPYLADPKLKTTAAEAVLPLALKLREAGEHERVINLCRKCIEASDNRNIIRDAAKCLRELGVDLRLAAERGSIVNWWVVGPFPGRERITKEDFVPTNQPIDLTQKVRDGDRELEWRYVAVDDPFGMLDFEREVARMDNCGAYAYAEIQSPIEQEVLLKFGSDDSVFCWLNGEQVHAWDGNRAWGQDQDTVKAHLKAGTNTILCKVINGGAQWSLSVRLTELDGKPIITQQRAQ